MDLVPALVVVVVVAVDLAPPVGVVVDVVPAVVVVVVALVPAVGVVVPLLRVVAVVALAVVETEIVAVVVALVSSTILNISNLKLECCINNLFKYPYSVTVKIVPQNNTNVV